MCWDAKKSVSQAQLSVTSPQKYQAITVTQFPSRIPPGWALEWMKQKTKEPQNFPRTQWGTTLIPWTHRVDSRRILDGYQGSTGESLQGLAMLQTSMSCSFILVNHKETTQDKLNKIHRQCQGFLRSQVIIFAPLSWRNMAGVSIQDDQKCGGCLLFSTMLLLESFLVAFFNVFRPCRSRYEEMQSTIRKRKSNFKSSSWKIFCL